MKHKHILILLALALQAVAALRVPAETPGAERMRVLVPQTTAALPFLVMARENPLPGVEIQVDTFLQHAQALALLVRGEADLLFTGTSQGWENRQGGSPIVMVDTGIWGISSLVGREEGIRSFADLKGKRIALPFPGSPLDFQTRAIFAREKLDPDRDLEISYGPFTQSLPKLMAGKLDAVALPEPMATAVVKGKGLARLVTYADEWARVAGGDGRSPQVSLFALDAYARTHKRLLADVVAAWSEASRKVEGSPAQAAGEFAARLGVDAGVLEEAARHTLYGVPSVADNTAKVKAYYRDVRRFLPDSRLTLDEGFFFSP